VDTLFGRGVQEVGRAGGVSARQESALWPVSQKDDGAYLRSLIFLIQKESSNM